MLCWNLGFERSFHWWTGSAIRFPARRSGRIWNKISHSRQKRSITSLRIAIAVAPFLISFSLRSMAVLSSRAQERRSRGPRNSRSKCVFQVAPAPISSWFLCPRPPLLLTAPNQNRHDTQARFHLACCAGVFFGRVNFFARENAMLLCLLSLIFLRHKIKDGGYNNTNINKKLSPAQNAPALQARFHSVRFTYYLSR